MQHYVDDHLELPTCVYRVVAMYRMTDLELQRDNTWRNLRRLPNWPLYDGRMSKTLSMRPTTIYLI